MSELSEAINEMVTVKGISLEQVKDTIEKTLLATYKRKYGTDENAEVSFAEDLSSVTLSKRVTVVDEDNYYDPVTEISLEEAQELNEEAEIGDSLLIPIDPKTFDRISVQTGKQRAQSEFRGILQDDLLHEFQSKQGEIINGYVQTVKEDGDILVNLGKTTGFLPRKNQSPRETYQKDDRIRCYVESVKKDEKNNRNVRVLLSRVHEKFIEKLFEVHIPELGAKDPSIEIMKIVREAGYRTKVAVYPKKVDVDAVGTCVGIKGNRIQAIMSEIDDERIDVIKWDPNPLAYLANALSPAKVEKVIVVDEDKKMAVAIVDEQQLSLAIGKQGMNVRLVNRLCDWIVDVKTQDQFNEMDISKEARAAADAIFSTEANEDVEEPVTADEEVLEEEEYLLEELPLDPQLIEKAKFHDIYTVEEFINLTDEELSKMDRLTAEDIAAINKVISENVDIAYDDGDEDNEVSFTCPNCGHEITMGMTECPNCHVELSFEDEE